MESRPTKRPAVRVWFLGLVVIGASLIAWLAWPQEQQDGPYELSRQDGKSRFWATSLPKSERPEKLSLLQRLRWDFDQYRERRQRPNPTRYTFPATPTQSFGITALLNQCMEVSGTQYLVAVEIAGVVEFGTTNSLNGALWVAAFENALENSRPVVCYDYAKKRNFQDTLLLIRETRGVVKVIPRSKLDDYRKAGLVKGGSEG